MTNLTDYLTTREVAARYGCSRAWVCQLCKDGRIPAEMIGGRWLIKLKDLQTREAEEKSHEKSNRQL